MSSFVIFISFFYCLFIVIYVFYIFGSILLQHEVVGWGPMNIGWHMREVHMNSLKCLRNKALKLTRLKLLSNE